MAALADPDRGWDAIVIGEYERAFYGSQYVSMAPLFEHYGVQLWMPEVGGRVDWHAEDHEETMLALGLSSKREIVRTWVRVRTAMAAQTLEQGRYLAAIAILLSGQARAPGRGNRSLTQLTGPAGAAVLINHLRATGTVLTYDPRDRTLRAGGHDELSVIIGKNH